MGNEPSVSQHHGDTSHPDLNRMHPSVGGRGGGDDEFGHSRGGGGYGGEGHRALRRFDSSLSIDEEDEEDDASLHNRSIRQMTYDASAATQQPRRNSLKQSFTGGSLRANLAAVERGDEKKKYVDPILSAAAVGAARRKEKRERAEKQQQRQRQRVHQNSRGTSEADNEWKVSLRRLANAASSTAYTVANVTAPALADASNIVVGTAKGFAHELQGDWKDEPGRQFVHDEESVVLFPFSSSPFSPAGRASWLQSSSQSFDMSPGSFRSGTDERGKPFTSEVRPDDSESFPELFCLVPTFLTQCSCHGGAPQYPRLDRSDRRLVVLSDYNARTLQLRRLPIFQNTKRIDKL